MILVALDGPTARIWEGGAHTRMWRSRDSLEELVLFFHHVDPADQVHIIRGTGELRALAALVEDTGSVLSTHMIVQRITVFNTNSKRV